MLTWRKCYPWGNGCHQVTVTLVLLCALQQQQSPLQEGPLQLVGPHPLLHQACGMWLVVKFYNDVIGPSRGRGRGTTSRKRKNPYDGNNDNDSGCVVSSVNGFSGSLVSSQPQNNYYSRSYSTSYGSQPIPGNRAPSSSSFSSGYGSRPTSSASFPTTSR